MSRIKPPHDNTKTTRRHRGLLFGLTAVGIVLAVILCILFLRGCQDTGKGGFFDPNAQFGVLPGQSEEERKADLEKIVREGMFNISIASVVVVERDGLTAHLRIENIAANHHHMSVAIRLDGSDRIVYESGGLSPGQYIETSKLSKKLAPGEYEATAVFTAYSMDTLKEAGTAAAKIRIIVPAEPN